MRGTQGTRRGLVFQVVKSFGDRGMMTLELKQESPKRASCKTEAALGPRAFSPLCMIALPVTVLATGKSPFSSQMIPSLSWLLPPCLM